jgi:thioesterase domain-containing protein
MPKARAGNARMQERLVREFPLAKHMGVIVESAEAAGVVLRAPFAPNINYKGSAFGGSLYSLSVLAGWCWITRCLESRAIPADAVIQESTMRFLAPVRGELRASALAPPPPRIEKFCAMLHRRGRGRIALQVDIYFEQATATIFEGVFAAAIRQEGISK